MHEFHTAAVHIDPQTLQYHLERRDFSRWPADTIADADFAAQVAVGEVEQQTYRGADLQRGRHRLIHAVEQRYLNPADRG